MNERQMDSVKPEPRASARAGFLSAAPSANEQEKSCPSISQTAYLGLGSNLGDRLALLRAALHALDTRDGIKTIGTAELHRFMKRAPLAARLISLGI